VFRTIIPRNIRLAEAPSFGRPVLFHDKESRGALAYLALAGEMIRREDEEREAAAGIVEGPPGAAGTQADEGTAAGANGASEPHSPGNEMAAGGSPVTSTGRPTSL